MFAVIFEVALKADQWDTYLDVARMLKPELERIDGFVDNERFASQRTPGLLLSLSTWRDEKALVRWRTLAVHHDAQERGRCAVFADYHLRVGEITADSHVPHGQDLRQERFDTTTVGRAQVVTITEATSAAVAPWPTIYHGAVGLVDVEMYESITTPAKMLGIASWHDEAARVAWQENRPRFVPDAHDPPVRHRAVRIIRDYGMGDRHEAPQYYPPVTSAALSAFE